jgi:fermentation-respiration switch protein FrsA (DUF1100 family)
MKRSLKIIGWTLLGFYLFVSLLGSLIYNSMLFFPPPVSYSLGGPIQMIDNSDGGEIAVWQQIRPEAEFTILYSHGNAESLGEIAFVSQLFVEQGFSFVAYDYSGYGLSSGKPTVENTYRDIETVYRFLTEAQGIAPEKILLFGSSIGSGPSTYLAAKKPVGGLILQSAFTSVYRVVSNNVPLFFGSPYPNLKRITSIDCPLLVIHGTEDEVIPFPHGEKLFAEANAPKFFHPVEGSNHNEIFFFANEGYWEKVKTFMRM